MNETDNTDPDFNTRDTLEIPRLDDPWFVDEDKYIVDPEFDSYE